MDAWAGGAGPGAAAAAVDGDGGPWGGLALATANDLLSLAQILAHKLKT